MHVPGYICTYPVIDRTFRARTRTQTPQQVTEGHLVNLAATDVGRFPPCAIYINCIWGSPLSALITLAVGLRVIGISFLVGFAALLMHIPLQARLHINMLALLFSEM
ncbi:unnamed protein product, partial [Scytosiphon promiscuus]